VPQPGGFYGGWITSWVAGPFKGAADRTDELRKTLLDNDIEPAGDPVAWF
jgi:hypothetical protein